MHLLSRSYIYVLKSAVARYQTIQRTMATERRDEEGNSSRGETAGNSETDSPPLAHGKHFALHLRPLVNVLCVCVCVCVCVCTQHAKRHMCLCDVCVCVCVFAHNMLRDTCVYVMYVLQSREGIHPALQATVRRSPSCSRVRPSNLSPTQSSSLFSMPTM